ncbi:hypothetical protein D3C81_2250690 [compost metagenome]
MELLGVAGVDFAQLGFEKLLGFARGEAQVAQVQFQHLFLTAQPRQRQGHGTA